MTKIQTSSLTAYDIKLQKKVEIDHWAIIMNHRVRLDPKEKGKHLEKN